MNSLNQAFLGSGNQTRGKISKNFKAKWRRGQFMKKTQTFYVTYMLLFQETLQLALLKSTKMLRAGKSISVVINYYFF